MTRKKIFLLILLILVITFVVVDLIYGIDKAFIVILSIVILGMLLILAGGLLYIAAIVIAALIETFTSRNGPPLDDVKDNGYTTEELNHYLELYGVKDPVPPELRDLLRKKSQSNLYQYGKIVMPDGHVVFDATEIRTQVYQGKKYYLLADEDDEVYINDDPEDMATYIFSLNPDIREFYADIIDVVPETDDFIPWKRVGDAEFYTIGDTIASDIAMYEALRKKEEMKRKQRKKR